MKLRGTTTHWPCGHLRTPENIQRIGVSGERCRECRRRIARESASRRKQEGKVRKRKDAAVGRPHCRNIETCAAKGMGHCRPCSAAAIMLNPENRAKQRAGLAAFVADPIRSAKHRAAAERNIAEYRARPGVAEHLKERMKRIHAMSQTPEVLEKLRASGAARGRKRTATVLPWCPPEYLDDYRLLVRKSGYTAEEARTVIEQQMRDRDPVAAARRAIAAFNDNQRARAEREKAQAY